MPILNPKCFTFAFHYFMSGKISPSKIKEAMCLQPLNSVYTDSTPNTVEGYCNIVLPKQGLLYTCQRHQNCFGCLVLGAETGCFFGWERQYLEEWLVLCVEVASPLPLSG